MEESEARSSARDYLEPSSGTTKVCDKCGSRFSGDSRFCPFDGEPLQVAVEARRPSDPLIGTVIDSRYEVESILGEGGMGTVYKVTHRVLGKRLALKVLRADLSREEELGLRFLREARAAASISHPHVVQITDFGTLPTRQPYFVMELLTGESLSSMLRKGGPLPAARAVRILRQMVEGLDAAHAVGVVHRDLKPDNILICPGHDGTEVVKVLDFGLAKVAGQSRLTKAGVVFGTPHYMSPEQASGGTVDQRTDVYALGVVMYEMFTGRVPFEADTYMGVLTKHLYVAPTPPSVVVGGIHELGALEQVTLRCIEKKADKRYPSMRALANDLARVTHFADDGSLVVKPAELGLPYESSLADELELPGTLELRATHGRRHDEERRHVTWLIAALAFLGLFAVALIAALSFRTNSPGAAALVTAPAPETASVRAKDASNPERAGSAGAVRSEPIPGRGATKPVPAAVDTAEGVGVGIPAPAAPSSARSTAVRGVPIDVPAKTRAKTPRVTAPPAANSPRTKEKSVTGDIVDPWGG